MSKIELCTNMNGKMKGICSISTSVTSNPNCQKNHKIAKSICEHCYSHQMAKMYVALDQKNQRNTDALTHKLLPIKDLPIIDEKKFPYCRLEAFGDLHNEIHLHNYMNIVKKNPKVKWALYTKMYSLALNYFKTHKVPKNFTLVISSLFVNKPIDLTSYRKITNFAPGQLKVFTVWDSDYIKKHHKEINLNCGARSCFKCHACYDYRNHPIENINEILKSDQATIGVFEGLNNPALRQQSVNEIAEFIDIID